MTAEQQKKLFCRKEKRSFPADQFYPLEGWGLVHDVQPLHTKEGTIVETIVESKPNQRVPVAARTPGEQR
jgi:hypothetical protein